MGKKSFGSMAAMSVWRLAQTLYGRQLVVAAYRGVLGRQPDESGAESYALELGGPDGLAGVIAGLVASDEFWRRTLIDHSRDLTKALTNGLFGEAVGDGVLRAEAGRLVEQGELDSAISVLAHSAEFWASVFCERAPELANQIERALFGERVDQAWRDEIVQALRQGPDGLATALDLACRSQEHWDGLFIERSSAFVQSAFEGLLGRPAESDAVDAYSSRLSNISSLGEVLAAIATSDEAWQRNFGTRASELTSLIEQSMFGKEVDEVWREHAKQTLQQGPKGLPEILLRAARSRQHLELLLVERAREFVDLTFEAVLGRPADAEAIAAYAPCIHSIAGLEKVVGEVASSEEAWHRHLALRGGELVQQIYRAVLQRAADPTEIERWQEEGGASIAGLRHLLEALLNSEEFERNQFVGAEPGRGLSAELLDAAYRGMLGRPADRNGLNEYTKRITKATDLSWVITALRKSNEFRKLLAETEQSPEPAGSWHEFVARIEGLYLRYLKRPASAQEIAQYLTEETPLWQIQAELMEKAPARTEPLRVLLFGAFGNGNMGDAYQALAVRSHLQQRFGNLPVELFATSLLSSSNYSYPEEYKLPSQSILDPKLVNSFDYLVIGGGGLLAHPHDPLADAKWCRSILTPIILLAVGASEPEAARHHTLLQQALHVVGRDPVSVSALRTVRPDVRLAADPILCISSVQEMLIKPFAEFADPASDSVLWVLKYPSNDEDEVLLSQVRQYIKQNSHQRHVIVGIEPALDHLLIEQFSETHVCLTEDLDQLCQHISQAGQVFSMRYHGAIFALLMNRPVIGASQSKLRELANRLGHMNGYLERGCEIAHEMWRGAMSASPIQLAALGNEFAQMLRALRLA